MMDKVNIYHNPRCTKSRQGLQYLKEKGIDPQVTEYLKTPLSFKELSALVDKLGIDPEDLVRKNEADYKDNFKGQKLSREEWIQAMIDYPKLIQRPIIEVGENAVIGRPVENIDNLLN